MHRRHIAAVLIPGLLMVSSPGFAQVPSSGRPAAPAAAPAVQPPVSTPAPAPTPVMLYQNSDRAENVREQLNEVLSRYPPALRQVIQIDSTLLERPDYLAPYPMLATFIQQHPEVARNPTYYFGAPFPREERTSYSLANRIVENLSFLAGFLTIVSLVYLLLRQALEYRRWRKQIQVQTDVHLKLVDRLTNNQELLAYMQTAAGRQFLEAPSSLVATPSGWTMAPMARILWSVQIGVVVVAIGIGLQVSRVTIQDQELSNAFQVMGTLAAAAGVGFIASALVSWALSLRMGLMSAPMSKGE